MLLAFSKVLETCAKSNLNFQDKSVLLQVSGGPDSIFLLHAFHNLFGKIAKAVEVLTINFELRGEESKKEVVFVSDLCRTLDYACHQVTAPKLSKIKGNIQKIIRDFRIKQVKKIMRERQLDYTLMGHHQDDLLETFFLKLRRGASLFSMTSFDVVTGNCIRPLLYYSKQEILIHLKELNLPYKMDSSNFKNKYERNRIRNEIFKSLDDNLNHWRNGFLASYYDLKQESLLIEQLFSLNQIMRFHLGLLIPSDKFPTLDIYQRQIVIKWYLKKMGLLLSGGQISEITQLITKGSYGEYLIDGKKYICEKGVFYQQPEIFPFINLKLNCKKQWLDNYFLFAQTEYPDFDFEFSKRVDFVSSKKLEKITLRPPKAGDKIVLKKVGRKKISDVFTDAKVPHLLRRLSWVVEMESEILSLVIGDIKLFNFFKQHKDLKRNSPLIISEIVERQRGNWKYTCFWKCL